MSNSDQNNIYALRLSDVEQHLHQSLKPIEGYETEPLVTLDVAIQPLIPIVFGIENMVVLIKDRLKTPLDTLTKEESASIMLYTLGWTTPETSFYMKLNNVLRSEDRHFLQPWLLYLRLFLTALEKLPSKNVTVYRGVKGDISDQYPEGKEFVWWALTSCTSTMKVLESDLFLGKSDPRTLFAIAIHSGKDICQHSAIIKENEILLPPARQFRVKANLDQGNDFHIIQLEEIEPEYPLLSPLSIEDHLHDNTIYRNDELEQMISKCQSKKLDFRGKCLNDRDMILIVQRGINEKQCSILDLSGIEVTNDGILSLARTFKNNIYLEELNLSCANISDSDIRSLASIINSTGLKRLHLESNDISDDGAKHLAQMLKRNTKLIQLSLSVNQISSAGVIILAKAITLPNVSLQILNLSGNTNVNDQCIDSLVSMIELNQSLTKLHLRCCDFSEDAKVKLRSVAKSRKGFDFRL